MSSSSGSSPDLSDVKIVSRTRRGSKRLKDEGILDKVKQSYWANMTKVMTHDIGVHGKIDLMVGRNASAKEIREYVQEIVKDDASKHNSTDEEVPDDSSDRFLDNLSDLLRREEVSAEENVTKDCYIKNSYVVVVVALGWCSGTLHQPSATTTTTYEFFM